MNFPATHEIARWWRTVLGHPLNPFASDDKRREWCDFAMRLASLRGNFKKTERIFANFATQRSPSIWATSHYAAKVVDAGLAQRLDEVLASPQLRTDHRPLLLVAQQRRIGNLAGALEEIRFDSPSSEVRFKMAQAERSIYHQMRHHEAKAEAGVRFMGAEPDLFLAEYAFNAAGSAENCGRTDLSTAAMARALADVGRIKANGDALRGKWKEGMRVALKLFDLDGGLLIARTAARRGNMMAAYEVARIEALISEVSSWRRYIDMAHSDVVDRATVARGAQGADLPVVVLHSAAFSTNIIDYTGFRADIRRALQSVLLSLEGSGVRFAIGSKLSTHGRYRHSQPYFSYHTIADDLVGLHFKETDRPSSFSFDSMGYSGWSDFSHRPVVEREAGAIEDETAALFFKTEQQRVFAGNISKYAQPAKSSGAHGFVQPYVLVALQIQGDAVQELAYSDTLDMLNEVHAVCASLGIPLVVKRHPYCKSPKIERALIEGVASHKYTVSKGNIHELIEGSVAVCVVNSSVGAEALLHEKPVYVFGRSEYMQACFVCEAPGDFGRIFEPGKNRLSTEALHRFWYGLRNEFALDLSRPDAGKEIARRVADHMVRNLHS